MHIDFLVRVLAIVVARDITGNNDHRDGVEGGIGNTGQDIGDTRAKVAHNHRCLVGQTRISVRCGRSNSLVTVGDVLYLLAA